MTMLEEMDRLLASIHASFISCAACVVIMRGAMRAGDVALVEPSGIELGKHEMAVRTSMAEVARIDALLRGGGPDAKAH